ncbi:hypothetical protein II941_00675 [bacterium]|nr:hypothetical protein [bacterium]
MENIPFSHDRISSRLKQLAFLNKGLKITFIDENPKLRQTFKDAADEEFQSHQVGENDELEVSTNEDNQIASSNESKINNDQENKNSSNSWPIEE